MRPRSVKGQRKFAGRKRAFRYWVHALVDRAWCDRLDFKLGFCRDALWRVLHQTPIEGQAPLPLKRWHMWSCGSIVCHALETIPFPRTGPFKGSGFRPPEGPVQLVPGSGEGQHTSNASMLKRVMGRSAAARESSALAAGTPSIAATACSQAHTDGVSGFQQVCPQWLQLGVELTPPPPNQSW